MKMIQNPEERIGECPVGAPQENAILVRRGLSRGLNVEKPSIATQNIE